MSTMVRVDKLPEIIKALDTLKYRTRTNLVRRGLYAGGIVLRDEARRLAHVRTGALKKAIVAIRGDPSPAGEAGSGRPAAVDQVVSYGIGKVRFVATKKGRLRRAGKTTRASRRASGLEYIFPRLYAHLIEIGTPRIKKDSFILQAATNKASAAVDAVVAKMNIDLDAEVSKLRP